MNRHNQSQRTKWLSAIAAMSIRVRGRAKLGLDANEVTERSVDYGNLTCRRLESPARPKCANRHRDRCVFGFHHRDG